MKLRRVAARVLILSVLFLSACNEIPQETTCSTLPHETAAPIETTESTKTSEPTETADAIANATMTFFTYETSPVLAHFNYYIAPAGTEDWYPVYINIYAEYCWHQRSPESNPDDTVTIRRAYVNYDGPEVETWILRMEFNGKEEAIAMHGDWGDYSYQWSTEFELVNNETLLYLDTPDGYVHKDSDTLGDGLIPAAAEMVFCDNCPAQWLIPVE